MSRPFWTRFLAAGLLAIPVAFLVFGREQARLAEWTTDPQTALDAYMKALRHNSIVFQLSVSLLLILGITLIVEGLSVLVDAAWRRSTR
jgi:hypothetical protein